MLADKFQSAGAFDLRKAEREAVFFSGLWCTEVRSVRDEGHTISVILGEDWERWKHQHGARVPKRDWLREHEVSIPMRSEILGWKERAGYLPVAPEAQVSYCWDDEKRQGDGSGMAQELIYELNDPEVHESITALHLEGSRRRYGLGRFAIQLHRESTRTSLLIALWWFGVTNSPIPEALQSILNASFQIEGDLIDLPGQAPDGMGADCVWRSTTATAAPFCSTTRCDPPRRALRARRRWRCAIRTPKPSTSSRTNRLVATFISNAAHRSTRRRVRRPFQLTTSQAIVPGALSGAEALEVSGKEGLLLLFLIVGSTVFLLRSRSRK